MAEPAKEKLVGRRLLADLEKQAELKKKADAAAAEEAAAKKRGDEEAAKKAAAEKDEFRTLLTETRDGIAWLRKKLGD